MTELAEEKKNTRNKNKIGARTLSPWEAKMILPTYPQIETQIDQFRSEREREQENISQKTNNIGIIGVRGAGKTSLLKTIREELLEKNSQGRDLIFPIIVPENMSQSSTLMATILGMMKKYVDETHKKEKQRTSYSDCERGSGIVKRYEEVVKQYTFIQKEYRDILIHEYTTENDYAKSSAKIFNSDIEFITKFHELVLELLSGHEDGMIFLFIDDIDLSTHRCTDVVKTLLSYLSNENIVTFISGDLETFEEALTVDFLRQEKVLGKDILGESMLENPKAGTFLDSKKKLAYEYLKKILPPVYRHNIKEWALEEKGTYCIQGEEEDNGKDFAWYLSEALEGWVDPAFFQCYDEDAGMGALPYTYHLFDNTSRGLNNVYNVLKEIAFLRKNWQEKPRDEDVLGKKKQLLDTIISSKHMYNQHRNEILGNMFYVGSRGGQVFFDNALAIIYPENDQNRPPVERFSLFLLVDFAARLFYEGEYGAKSIRNSDYRKLKRAAMKDLILYPEIAGKAMPARYDSLKGVEVTEKKEVTLLGVSSSFLRKGDLVFNLAFYRNMPMDTLLTLHQVPDKELQNVKADMTRMKQDVFLAFWRAVLSVGKATNKEGVLLEEYYPVFWKEFEYMQSQLSSIPVQNAVMKLFDEECEKEIPSLKIILEKLEIDKDKEGVASQRNARDWLKRILLNTVAEYVEPIWNGNGSLPDIPLIEKGVFEERDYSKIYKIISVISKQNLWGEEAAGKVVEYLAQEVKNRLHQIISNMFDSEWIINTKRAISGWKEFSASYHGVSNTKSVIVKRRVQRLLKKEAFGEEEKPLQTSDIENILESGISYETFLEILVEVSELSQNYRVWYGRREAQELLNGLLKCYIAPLVPGMEEEEDFQFFLRHYFIYKTSVGDDDEIHRQAELMQQITEQLSEAHLKADQRVLDSFIDRLNNALGDDEQLDQEEFENLFG